MGACTHHFSDITLLKQISSSFFSFAFSTEAKGKIGVHLLMIFKTFLHVTNFKSCYLKFLQNTCYILVTKIWKHSRIWGFKLYLCFCSKYEPYLQKMFFFKCPKTKKFRKIQKSFDNSSWNFLYHVLMYSRVPNKRVGWNKHVGRKIL